MNEIEEYIYRAAMARGIDPNQALKLARGEGGTKDPYRRAQGFRMKDGRKVMEPSYGPFQLNMGNEAYKPGMGADALNKGIDPRKDW